MATTVTHVIDPDAGTGYDYDSLYDWEAAEQGDLTGARDEIAVAKCRCTGGTTDTTAVTIDGWTTSATQYIKIWTDPAESYRHTGKWESSGNYYKLFVTSIDTATAITISENNVLLDGLLLGVSIVWNSGSALSSIDQTNVKILNTIGRITGAGGSASSAFSISSSSTYAYIFVNCIAINSAADGFHFGQDSSLSATAYNCVAVSCGGYGFYGFSNRALLKNCIAHSCATNDFNIDLGVTGSTNNGSEDGSAPDTNEIDLSSYSLSQIFDDATNFDFHLISSSPAIGVGVNLYNDATYPFQDDIDGDDRGGSGASWDIGADEYVAAGGASAVPVHLINRNPMAQLIGR